MKNLRDQARRPEPTEILRLALKSGLTKHEALIELRKQDRHYPAAGEGDLLPIFFAALTAQADAGPILEYASSPFLQTSHLIDESRMQQLTLATPYAPLAELLQMLVEGTSSLAVQGISNLPRDSRWKMIICQPPIGHRASGDKTADGFGGEVVRELAPLLADGGTLYWVTGRGVLWQRRAKKTLYDLHREGLNIVATIDVAPGALPGTSIPSTVIALRRELPSKKFVGALRDLDDSEPVATAYLAGPRNSGPSWSWLDSTDSRTFADLERARVLRELTPRGRLTLVPVGSLLKDDKVIKADRASTDEDATAAFLFVPEYATSSVTADLDSQSVKPKAVYRLTIDPSKANPRFLAQLLNSPYGRHLRESAARGATIKRISVDTLLSLELPIPDIAAQDMIARIGSDIGLLRASFRDMQTALDQDWTGLSDVAETIDKLKAVLDIERQIEDWWAELPYPLATIYRRYQVSADPRERLETLLHFFEMATVYLATIGASHVKLMRNDWQDVLAKWLHPPGSFGIERADFGFWISLARASLKDTDRIGSDKALRRLASELAGSEVVQFTRIIGSLRKAAEPLDVARRCRNSWKGHGGLIKPNDAERLVDSLQQSIRDFYEIAASTLRRLHLVKPGLAEFTDTGHRYQVERLSGSDPTFEKVSVELDRPAKTNALAFWMNGARTMCHALPFFRLGAPQQPQERSCYVFNRIENGGCRWISYQEAREQEFVAPDDELLALIALGKSGP